jgi:GGDEF domain-containing protein
MPLATPYCTTAIAIRESLRGSDLGAHWGGDEFAIIAPETSREAAEQLDDGC